jgi:hypothetical protein
VASLCLILVISDSNSSSILLAGEHNTFTTKTEISKNATRSMDLQSRSTGSTLTAAERDNILNLHNVARQSVSPPASDMKTMVGFNDICFNKIIKMNASINIDNAIAWSMYARS